MTPATQYLIGERELALLPAGAIEINDGRGKIIDRHAFYQTLKSAPMGAAAMGYCPCGELEHVILTPHRAGGLNAADTERLRVEHLAKLIDLTAHCDILPNRVDPARGY